MATTPPNDPSNPLFSPAGLTEEQLTRQRDLLSEIRRLYTQGIQGKDATPLIAFQNAVNNVTASVTALKQEATDSAVAEEFEKQLRVVEQLKEVFGQVDFKAGFQNSIKALTQAANAQERIVEAQKRINEYEKIGLPTSQLGYEIEQAQLDIQRAEQKLRSEQLSLTQQERDAAKQQYELLLSQKIVLERIQQVYSDSIPIYQSLTGVTQRYGGYLGVLQNAIQGGASAFRGMKDAASDLFTSLNIGLAITGRIVAETIHLVSAADNAYASFNRTTGAIGEYRDVISGSYKAVNEYGIGIEGASAATAALVSQTARFSEMAPDTQRTMVVSAAKLERLGISASETAGHMDFLTKSINMGGIEAKETFESMVLEGRKLGVVPQQLSRSFAASRQYLAAYGREGVSHFMNLTKMAKEAGVAVEKLAAAHDRLSNLENALNAAAGLAVQAGKQILDPLALLGASPEKKMRMVQEALRALGKGALQTYQDWQHAEQATGFSVEDLKAIMNGQATSMDKAQKRQQDMNTIIEASVTMVEKLRSAFQTLAGPFNAIIDAVRPILTAFDHLMNLGDGLVGKIIGWGAAAFFLGRAIRGIGTSSAVAATTTTAAAAQTATAYTGSSAVISSFGASHAMVSGTIMANNQAMVASTAASSTAIVGWWARTKAAVLGMAASMKAALISTGIGALLVGGSMLISSFFSGGEAEGEAEDYGEAIPQQMAQGITNNTSSVSYATNNMASEVRDRLPSSPAKKGPLSDIDRVGPGMTNTIANSITRNRSTVTNAVSNMASEAKQAITNNVSSRTSTANMTTAPQTMSSTTEEIRTANNTQENYIRQSSHTNIANRSSTVSTSNNNTNNSSNSATNLQQNSNVTNNGRSGGVAVLQPVILQVDKRELGRITLELLDSQMNMTQSIAAKLS